MRRQEDDVFYADAVFAALDVPDVVSMQTGEIRELFLRQATLHP